MKRNFFFFYPCLLLSLATVLLAGSSSCPSSENINKMLMPQLTKTLKYPLIGVDGGTFWMGRDDEYSYSLNERPRHSVSVSDFFIGKYEVTQQLWKQVMGNNPSKYKGSNQPVENVSWDDCQKFITLLNRRRGEMNLGEFSDWHFRLPTEAEWEYAAQGGNKSRGFVFAGSNDLSEVAWYYENSNSQTHDVGGKNPNELGIYDMSGNVWEWCEDRYDGSYYETSPSMNPHGPLSGSERVVRGGDYSHPYKIGCLVWNRSCNTQNSNTSEIGLIGLRLVLVP